MKKRYKMRFYKAHDIDLITYIASHTINIGMTLYFVIRAYCNGEVIGIRIPEHSEPRPSEYKKIYYTYLSLDTENDKKIIDFMDGIKPGFRNNFLKNLLRQYLCTPIVEDFLVNPSDYPEVERTTKLLQGNRSMVALDYATMKKRASTKKRSRKAPEISVKSEVTQESHRVKDPAPDVSSIKDKAEEDAFYASLLQLAKKQGMTREAENAILSSFADKNNVSLSNEENRHPLQDDDNFPMKKADQAEAIQETTSDENRFSVEAETDMDTDDDDLTDAFSQILSM